MKKYVVVKNQHGQFGVMIAENKQVVIERESLEFCTNYCKTQNDALNDVWTPIESETN